MRSTDSARPRRTALRLRRRVRTGAAALVLGCVALAGAAVVAPAQAAVVAPKVRLVPGDRALTAAWAGVAGATSYTVRWSAKRSLSHARTVTTTKQAIRLPKLRNGEPTYVAVTANGVTLQTPAVVRSAVAAATPAAGVPFETSRVVAASGPGANEITVTWAGGGRAQKVAVVAGSTVVTDQRSFHSAWYPATTRSITITVPEQYRSTLGAGSGNPVWVKVVQSNSTSMAFGPSYSYDRKYRPSPVGTWAFAGAGVATAPVDRITVGELNIQSVGATASYSRANQWAARLPRVAKYINTTSPSLDLLTTAELATNVLDGCRNKLVNPYLCSSHTQVASLAKELTGLRLADTDAYDRVSDRMKAAPAWNAEVTNGAHIFYNPDRLTVLDWGYYAPAMATTDHSIRRVEGLGVSPWSVRTVGSDRWLTWAKLQVTSSGRQFYAVAAHFPVGNASAVVDARAQEAAALVSAIQSRAGSLPIVFGGDVNSDATRAAKPVQPVFIRNGWFDAAAVASKSLRTGMKVSTANGSGAQDGTDQGYGSKPIHHPYETSRIDYILLKNSPHTYSYANVLRLNPDGTFRKDLQGTDHNMQLAEIGIGDPVG
ncbi:hypothetical protein [uncultured Amnibacterium sp.]|uniref:hypothetical protein n=1 Tax=uncultured Amnibacterium sp. TaxID=1631851 RepID=UPI0035CB0B3D